MGHDEFFDSLNPKQITSLKWDRVLNKLYNEMYLHEWKKRYEDPNVLDGTSWELVVTMTNRRKRTYSGINDYPPYWSDLGRFSGNIRDFSGLSESINTFFCKIKGQELKHGLRRFFKVQVWFALLISSSKV